ncbi:5-deoxy-glucuronate isomerase, partial [Fusobacterium mortiferum]|nr:5-deoxy-glucuronate isomerase [Fusobacterium mortiferum]
DVFTEGPWCVHVCSGTKVTVKADSDAEILVQCTKNEKQFPAKLYAPEDAPWGYSSVGKFGNVAKRRVNTIFDHDIAPYSNMV